MKVVTLSTIETVFSVGSLQEKVQFRAVESLGQEGSAVEIRRTRMEREL
jgi:hypothetical protein